MSVCSRRAVRLGLVLVCTCLPACGRHERPLFRLLSPRRTGVTFANTVTESDRHNFQTNFYFYNGAGVGLGDVNGDGLPDIYLAGNMVSSRLYLNRGDMRFEDVTEAAGVATRGWAVGVSMVDIDGDGDVDIYVSVSGPPWSTPEQRRNLLFVNQGAAEAKRMCALLCQRHRLLAPRQPLVRIAQHPQRPGSKAVANHA